MKYEVGKYYKLNPSKSYWSVDLQRNVRFDGRVIVKLTNFVNDKAMFGNLVNTGIFAFSPDYDTNNSIEFNENDIIEEYTFNNGSVMFFDFPFCGFDNFFKL